jgi:aspartate/tyrosine/aromatic aminotransferase
MHVMTPNQRPQTQTPPHPPQEYLPIGGMPQFCNLTAALAFGAGAPAITEGRLATVQTLSGTGALAVGGAFIARHYTVRGAGVVGFEY